MVAHTGHADVAFWLLSWGAGTNCCDHMFALPRETVDRLAGMVTGGVGSSPDRPPSHTLACHCTWPFLTRCQASAPEPDFKLGRPSLSFPPSKGPPVPSHLPGSTWAPVGRGDTWVVSWPLEPPSALGQGRWASRVPCPHQTIFQLRSKHASDLSLRISAWRSQGTGVIRPLLS